MLEQARARLAALPDGTVTFLERTASEIDAIGEKSLDSLVASLSLSEMSRSERSFVLHQAFRVLRPGGVIAVADEVRPRTAVQRLWHALLRGPQAALAWIIVGSVSRPVEDLAGEVAAPGFALREERRWLFESLAMVIGERPS
jgi:ubiquinone/menaquinone biosynthesis C-methylase UbiE